jgi:transposase
MVVRTLVKAYVPLRFELGEAFQFDWSEERLVINGVWRKILASHLKLCASRAFVVLAYPTQSHEMLFDAHTRSFSALGGIPRRGIYDNMKTAVDKVNKGKGRTVNTRFAAMASHYLFDPDFCNVASGWEKGVVEKNVQDSRLAYLARRRQGTVWLIQRTESVAVGQVPANGAILVSSAGRRRYCGSVPSAAFSQRRTVLRVSPVRLSISDSERPSR